MFHDDAIPSVIKTAVTHAFDLTALFLQVCNYTCAVLSASEVKINITAFSKQRLFVKRSNPLPFLQNSNSSVFRKKTEQTFNGSVHCKVAMFNHICCCNPFKQNSFWGKNFIRQATYTSIHYTGDTLSTCHQKKPLPLVYVKRKDGQILRTTFPKS